MTLLMDTDNLYFYQGDPCHGPLVEGWTKLTTLFGRKFRLSCVKAPSPEESGGIEPNIRSDTYLSVHLFFWCGLLLLSAWTLPGWSHRNISFSGFWGQTRGARVAALTSSPFQHLLSSFLSVAAQSTILVWPIGTQLTCKHPSSPFSC